ncbi:hypothetical protein [Salicibibacter kimchii]|uniref:hypothetical protein n=1 Tax=Salicibibacter kimchii TaxID=2099786 RepID=UPI00202B257B|nr:hypothetical protein [Salicibibacter kimchii]
MKIGLLLNLQVVNLTGYLQMFSPFAVHSLHPHYSLVQMKEIKQWLYAGLQVYPYVVNKAAVANRMKEIGASGVIADASPRDLR